MLTQIDIEKIKESLNYDESSGKFTWVFSRGSSLAGSEAGAIKSHGYIEIGRESYLAHRLAYMFIYGSIDDGMEIDHRNGIKTDNRIINLRIATKSQNQHNSKKPKNNTSGYKCVYWSQVNCNWYVQVKKNRKVYAGGSFSCVHEAGNAAKNLRKRLHGAFARDN